MAQSVFTTTMTSGNSLATFDCAQTWHYQYVVIPTMTSGANVELWASFDTGTTFQQVRQPVGQTTTAQIFSFIVAASAAANGAIVPLPPGLQYIRLRADSAPTAATTFKIICGANF